MVLDDYKDLSKNGGADLNNEITYLKAFGNGNTTADNAISVNTDEDIKKCQTIYKLKTDNTNYDYRTDLDAKLATVSELRI